MLKPKIKSSSEGSFLWRISDLLARFPGINGDDLLDKMVHGELPYVYKERGGSAYLIGYEPSESPRTGQWTVYQATYQGSEPFLRRVSPTQG